MSRVVHALVSTAIVLAVSSTVAWAQAPKAGVVTTLEGNVTATHAATPQQQVPLKFKDDVLLQDRITTGSESLARLLLGGKAVVTVRERSVLTITEVPGRSTIDIESGKFALAVARERMRAGEVIEIRTPNAVAGVRGSVVVTEVQNLVGQSTTTDFYLLQGQPDSLAAQPADPATRAPIGTPRPVNVLEHFRVVGLIGTVNAIRPDQLPGIRAGLQPRSRPHVQSANAAQLSAEAMTTAVALANTVGALGAQTLLFPTPSPTNTIAPITPIDNGKKGSTDEALNSVSAVVNSASAVVNPLLGFAKLSTPFAGVSAPPAGLLTNGGFETGDFKGWTLDGAGGVITKFGTIVPPDGKSFMALIHTNTGIVLASCGTGKDCTRTTLSQSFVTTSSILSLKGLGAFLSNEFPTFTKGSVFQDHILITVTDATGKVFNLLDITVNDLDKFFDPAPATVSAAGFTLSKGGGQVAFDVGKRTIVVTPGKATLSFSVSNVSDTALDSAILLAAAGVTQDPPLYFVRDGATLAPGGTSPLLSLTNDSRTFDSLLTVCCNGAAVLSGPVLQATNSSLNVPFSLVSAIQGGTLTSSWPGPMVQLNGGSYTLGAEVGVFDVAGVNQRTDAATGLTVGADTPLRHGGIFLDATGATVKTGGVMVVDTALLEATAPLLNLKNSTLVSTDSALDLTYRANVTGLGPLFTLNGSSLSVNNGALVNLANGSILRVTGDLIHLSNGSMLSLLNGPLAKVTGNSIFSLSGSLVSFFGAGNTVSINNNLCSTISCASLGGLMVGLTGGASTANVSITNPIKGAGTFSVSPNGAAILVSGPGSKVAIGN